MTHTIRPRCSPALTRLSKGVRSALGFTLTETLLALGVVTAATGAMFLFFGQVDAKAKVASETRNLRELSRRIESSFGMVGTFRGVSTTAIVVDGLAPDSQLGVGESVLTNAWGGAVNVQPYTVERFGDSFSVSYAGLPRHACVNLVAANASGVWDAQVSDVSVIRNTGGQLDVGLLGRTCADKSRVVFVYHSGLLAGEWTGSPLVLPPATPSVTPPISPPVGSPVGPVGPVPPSTPVSPPTAPPPSAPPTTPPLVTPPAPPVSVTPPAPPTSPPVTPPPISTTTPCQEWSENRTINCPVGQVGQVFQNRRHHCGPDPSVYEAWAGSTTAGSWTTTSSTCTPCPAPETRNVGCPAGQFGAIGQQRTFTCTGTGSWNAWTQTNTTCAACPAPFPQAETQWVTTLAACPAGQNGSHTWQAEQRRTRMGSYNCPATTWSLPSPTFTTWTNWAETGVRRNEAITCTPNAPPPTFPEYTGRSWHSWGDGGHYGWAIFCNAPRTLAELQATSLACTWQYETNDTPTFTPEPPGVTRPTPALEACVYALRANLTPMPGYGFVNHPGTAVWPAACSCSVVGPGARFYWQDLGASDWVGFEFKCP